MSVGWPSCRLDELPKRLDHDVRLFPMNAMASAFDGFVHALRRFVRNLFMGLEPGGVLRSGGVLIGLAVDPLSLVLREDDQRHFPHGVLSLVEIGRASC